MVHSCFYPGALTQLTLLSSHILTLTLDFGFCFHSVRRVCAKPAMTEVRCGTILQSGASLRR